MDQVTIILPGDNGNGTPADTTCQQYPINALRQSSSYFDAMLSRRWSESPGDGDSDDEAISPAVDLSQLGLDQAACTSVLQFMVSRYNADTNDDGDKVGSCNDATQAEQCGSGALKDEEDRKQKKVTLKEIKVLFWSKVDDDATKTTSTTTTTTSREAFQWDEEEKTVDWGAGFLDEQNDGQQQQQQQLIRPQESETKLSNEILLYQAIDYLHLQPHDEILSKLWAMKIVHCPCFVETELKQQDLIGSRYEGSESEMYLKRIPEWSGWRNLKARMWRFVVCMFICRMLVCEELGETEDDEKYDDLANDQIRAKNHQRGLETYDALNQLSYLCSGIGKQPLLLLREMVSCGLLNKKDSTYWQTSLDSQVVALWELLDW